MKVFILAIVVIVFLSASTFGRRIYVRHRRSVEREGTPTQESTVVIASDTKSNDSASKDLPEELKPHLNQNESDCKSVFEIDYNPNRDMFLFNGFMPHLFKNNNRTRHLGPNQQGIEEINNLFHQMFSHASRMFSNPDFNLMKNHFEPVIPENTNRTTSKVVTLNGRQFLRNETAINKNIDGVKVQIVTTSFEEIKPAENEVSAPEINKDDQNATEHDEKDNKINDLTDGTSVPY